MNTPSSGPAAEPSVPEEQEINSTPNLEDTDDQDDLEVNKGIVKNIDELKEMIETNHPAPPEPE